MWVPAMSVGRRLERGLGTTSSSPAGWAMGSMGRKVHQTPVRKRMSAMVVPGRA